MATKRKLPKGVYDRGNGKYQGKVRRGAFKLHQLFEGPGALDAAERWVVQRRQEIMANDYDPGIKEREDTLTVLLDRYEREVTPEKKGAKQERNNLNLIRREDWAKIPVKSVRPRHIVAYRNRRQKDEGRAPSTINNVINLVSAVFRKAITEWDYDLRNPCAGLNRVPNNPGRNVKLVMSQLGDFLEQCEPAQSGYWWLPFVIKLQLLTAMRQGEVRHLRWGHLLKVKDGYAWHLPKTKNGEARDVPLLKEAEVVMEALKKAAPKRADDWVFGDPGLKASEGGFSTNLVTLAHRDAAARAGYKGRLTNHDLRHIACTMLSKFYPNELELSAVTGHKTLSMLKRYYNVSAEELVSGLHLGQRNRQRMEEEDRAAQTKKHAEETAKQRKDHDEQFAKDKIDEVERFHMLKELRATAASAGRDKMIADLEALAQRFRETYPEALPTEELAWEEREQEIANENAASHAYLEHAREMDEERALLRQAGIEDDEQSLQEA